MQSSSELKTKPTTLLPTEEHRSAKEIRQNLLTLPKGSVSFGQKLGNGAFGIVYQGEYRGMPVAIKEVDPSKAGKGVDIPEADILQAFEWEVSRLSTLSHTNLVHFYGVCENAEGNACLVMELCQKETLEKRLKQARNAKLGITPIVPTKPTAPTKLTDSSEPQKEHTYNVEESDEAAKSAYDVIEDSQPKPVINPVPTQSKTLIEPPLPLPEIWRIALEIAYGLAYLHQKGTLHRDLKSENILFGFDGHAKLADLGVAQVDALIEFQQAKVVAQGMKDFRYAAPEEFEGQSTPLCDMYSYGLVLCELVTGESIATSHISWRKEGKLEVIPDYCPSSLRTLIEQCWSINPQQRPTARDAILGLEAIAHEYTDQPARACLAQQTLEILEDQRNALSEYIPSDIETLQSPSKKDTDDELKDRNDKGDQKHNLDEEIKRDEVIQNISVQTQLQSFMQSGTLVCVIMGIGGLGKSLAGYVLADQLLNHPGPTTPLPIFIRPAIAHWTHTELTDGIQKALAHYRLIPKAMEQLKQTPVLFIVDGYDELSGDHQGNLPKQLRLDQWPHAKLLISVRPNVVPEDKLKERFAHRDQLVPYTLKPFDLPKVRAYLERALSPEEAASLQQTMRQTSLSQTLTNPFVLSLFIKSWDSQKKQDLRQLTQASIYQIAIQHWVYTQAIYLPIFAQHFLSGIDPTQPVDLEKLLKAAQLWLYQTAFAMAKNKTLSLLPLEDHPWNQLSQVVNQYAQNTMAERDRYIAAMPPEEAAQVRKRALLNTEQYQLLLQNKVQQFFALCPLKNRNGLQQFIHKTFWEYSVAQWIIDTLSVSASKLHQIKARGLHPRFILAEVGVLTFLRDMAQTNHFEQWETWIEASKQNEAATLPAACAITVLNGLQRRLSNRRWAGIRVPEADLRGAMLHQTDLTGADLQGARLEAASLQRTCLRQAKLEGVQFGQRPLLKFEKYVECIAIHPKGILLAAGLGNNSIVLQDSHTRQVTTTFKGHTGPIKGITFSPDGQCLASGSEDKTVCLWDVQSGTLRATLQGHRGEVSGVAFSPDRQYLASSSTDYTIRLWELPSGTLRATLQGHGYCAMSVAFSPDSQYLASGNVDKIVHVWEVKSGTHHTTLQGHTHCVNGVAFSPDGQFLASGSRDKTVYLWKFQSSTPHIILRRHTGEVYTVAFSPNSQYLVSGGEDQIVCLWDVQSGTLRTIFKGHTNLVRSITFSPDGQYVVSGGLDHTVCLWETKNGTLRATLRGHTKEVVSVAFSPDGQYLVSGSCDDTVRLWNVQNGTLRATFQGHKGQVRSVAFSPDGQYLASGSNDCTVCLWSFQNSTLLTTLQGHKGKVGSVTFSPDSQCLASSTNDNNVYDSTIYLWDVQNGTLRATLQGHGGGKVESVVFSPDGQCLASGSNDNTVRLWDVQSGTCYSTIRQGTYWVRSLVFSLDGRFLAGSGQMTNSNNNYTVYLWDRHTQRCLNTLYFVNEVRSISYAVTGALAMGVGDGVQLWQPDNHQSVKEDIPRMQLVWRTDTSTQLNLTDCDLTDSIGLTESDALLTEQLGATGKPCPNVQPQPSVSPRLVNNPNNTVPVGQNPNCLWNNPERSSQPGNVSASNSSNQTSFCTIS